MYKMYKKQICGLLGAGFLAFISTAQAESSFTTTPTVTPYVNLGLELNYSPPGFDKVWIAGLTSTLTPTGSFGIASLKFDVGYNATVPANYSYANHPNQVFNIAYTDSAGDSGTLVLPYDINISYSDTLIIHPATINLTRAGYTLTTESLTFGPQGNTTATRFLNASITSIPTPVPEPETYSMIIAGLGLLGLVGRGKKTKAIS
jgi:hypothetical protein